MLRFHRPPFQDRRFWLIQCTIVALVVADAMLGATGGEDLEFAPLVLLAFPVVYAALTFGGRGGVYTGLWSAALVLSDLALWYTGVVGREEAITWQPDAIGAVMLVSLGTLVGWRVERERRLQGDVTEYATRLEVAQAVRRHEEYSYQLMQHVSDVVMVMAADGTIRYQGPSDERVLGYRQGELIGQNAMELVHPDDLAAVAAAWQQCIQTPGITPTLEFRFLRRDGSWRVIEAIGNNRLDDPNVAGVIVTSRDITDRKEAAENIDRLRSEFFGMVSHELRTPVTVIRGLAAVELRRPFDAEEARESFAAILKSAITLQDLAENVLDLRRMEAGAFSVDREPVDVRSVVTEASDTFYQSIGSRKVEISLPDDIPYIEADLRRIVQVLLNLFHNAAKFSPPSEPILLSVERNDGYVVLHVKDYGRGIAPENLPHLFEKFFQVREDSGGLPGSGLGLAICKGIVESHGGRIWAESPGEGKGSTFSFTVPAIEP